MPDLVVFSRKGCHLCDVLIEELLTLVRGRATVTVQDIDTRDDWRESYDVRVPVVELDGVMLCEHSLDRERILSALSDLAERE